MSHRVRLALCVVFAWASARANDSEPKNEPGNVDPKQFALICEKADVIVVGKSFAVLKEVLDSEPPTPVYTTAQIETKGMKFVQGREKVGGNPEQRVADAFAELAQASDPIKDKTVIAAFKWEGKTGKILMLSVVNAADLGMIAKKFPGQK